MPHQQKVAHNCEVESRKKIKRWERTIKDCNCSENWFIQMGVKTNGHPHFYLLKSLKIKHYFPVHKCMLRCVCLPHKIPIMFIGVCGCNVTKRGTVQ